MTSKEIRTLFLDFFKQKDHTIVPSSSLISDDPSVLFTTAGMQQFKPYYLGEKSPYGENAASVQKCFRTSDIDSVGDESHLTFFEMLGNFSFGGYFKEKAIEYAHEFITKELKLKIDYVSVFGGDQENNIPADEESEKIWRKIAPGVEIKKAGKKDNFWGPTGDEGPCGPTTEIYINGIEIWNIVFNEYYKDKNGKFTKLKTPGVDTGMGLERLAMVVQNKPTIFETDLFEPIITAIIPIIGDKSINKIRITADHLRGTTFLIADDVEPSNTDKGYILRRIIRRAMLIHYKNIGGGTSVDFYKKPVEEIIDIYGQIEQYKNLIENKERILETIGKETEKFGKTLEKGLKELDKLVRIGSIEKIENGQKIKAFNRVNAKDAFYIYQTFGFPLEMIQEELAERMLIVDEDEFKKLQKEFQEEFKKHQEISRAGLEKKFGGHGLKEGGETTGATEEEKQKLTRLHTATHLLHQALFDLFGDKIKQMGSDINSERFRFDFPFERKLTAEELAKLETTVNQKIKEALPVRFEEKSKEEAIAEGAKAFFKVKYPEKVKVYYINEYSKEICNGPHVENTSLIGKFKILKEESVGAGIRRIKATVE